MDKLKELISLCKAGLFIDIDDHKNNYQTVEKCFEEKRGYIEDFDEDIPLDIREKCIELDTIISIQAYSHTPVGFFIIYHYDIELAIDKMIQLIKNDK
jgi:hypothetical protein